MQSLNKPIDEMEELKDDSSVVNWIKEKKIDLVINIPEGILYPLPSFLLVYSIFSLCRFYSPG